MRRMRREGRVIGDQKYAPRSLTTENRLLPSPLTGSAYSPPVRRILRLALNAGWSSLPSNSEAAAS